MDELSDERRPSARRHNGVSGVINQDAAHVGGRSHGAPTAGFLWRERGNEGTRKRGNEETRKRGNSCAITARHGVEAPDRLEALRAEEEIKDGVRVKGGGRERRVLLL
ncbi:hypothetical protein EYF80_047458 [Liparis tanakae]|uniref:Uncharacterized protein n=1 Tax=Liparis tanakae TaxID=230148 RepID=A0A4Z2FNM4_9TELE|nr:hypothetical protein EYF80_047458 [Liparis tanakae]